MCVCVCVYSVMGIHFGARVIAASRPWVSARAHVVCIRFRGAERPPKIADANSPGGGESVDPAGHRSAFPTAAHKVHGLYPHNGI